MAVQSNNYGQYGTAAAAAVDTENNIKQGIKDPNSIGGVPDYAALAKAIQQMSQIKLTLPPDVTAALDNAALNQLGNNEATIAQNGGKVAEAQRAISSDQVANNAVGGNMVAARHAGSAADQETNQAAMKEAGLASDTSLQSTAAVAANQLKAYLMQGQLHHANLSLQNSAQGMGQGLNMQQAKGIMATQQAANGAASALAAASLSNDQAAFGNAMTMLRGGLSALGSAASVASKFGGSSTLDSDYQNLGTTGSENGNPYVDVQNGAGFESGRYGTED